MTPAEVASVFRVRRPTVTAWANAGILHPIRTAGGHRRYKAAEVRALLAAGAQDRTGPPPPTPRDIDEVEALIAGEFA